jgi:hypothetical protein
MKSVALMTCVSPGVSQTKHAANMYVKLLKYLLHLVDNIIF